MASIPMNEVKRLNVGAGDVVSAELKPLVKDMFGAAKGKLGPYNRNEDRGHDRI